MTQASPSRRRAQHVRSFAHGWARRNDPSPSSQSQPGEAKPRAAPAGTSFLLGLVVLVVAGAGIARVRASTQVLALGAEITELTDHQGRLVQQKRRLLAERAYLRHPDQIAETARERLKMVPASPELVQQIRLIEEPSSKVDPTRR